MRSIEETINALKNGEYDNKLTYLYSCDKNDVKKYMGNLLFSDILTKKKEYTINFLSSYLMILLRQASMLI